MLLILPRHAFVLLCLTAVGGCVHAPAFQAALPERIETGDRAIAVIGDLQQTTRLVRAARRREDNGPAQQRLIADLRDHIDELAALTIVGDLVYTARSQRDWAHFDTLVAPFAERMPLLPAIGNHDYPCFLVQFCRSEKMAAGMQRRFPWMSPGQAYSVPAGRMLLLFLDSERDLQSQGAWLEAQLEQASGEYSTALVFFHRPAFSNSIDRGAEGNASVQQFIVPVLEASPIPTVVFSGHIHGYEHIVRAGIHYITTAGGGGPRGPMPSGTRPDAWRGPDCIQEDGTVLRPFNYLLLRETPGGIHIDVRGFCRGDAQVRVLDSIEIDFQ